MEEELKEDERSSREMRERVARHARAAAEPNVIAGKVILLSYLSRGLASVPVAIAPGPSQRGEMGLKKSMTFTMGNAGTSQSLVANATAASGVSSDTGFVAIDVMNSNDYSGRAPMSL